MALQDSTFRFTDPDITAFVVKPYAANGPSSPSTTALYSNPDGVSAVSANTSLVYVGRGTPFYGEVVLSNFTYLLENFSNKTRPNFPIIGQLWYKKADYTDPAYPSDPITRGLYLWSGLGWDPVVVAGALSPMLNLNNNRITNLGNAVDPQDAVNLATADSRYVQYTGVNNLTGLYVLGNGADLTADTGTTISVTDAPTDDLHVTNRAYVSAVAQALSSDISVLKGQVSSLANSSGNSIGPAGGTITGTLTIASGGQLVVQSGGASDPTFGGHALSHIAITPVAPDDAASKQYVDDTATSLNTTITNNAATVSAFQTDVSTHYARLDGSIMTGDLTLSSTSNLNVAVGSGQINMGGRKIQNVGYPAVSTDAAPKSYVDTAIAYNSTTKRWVIKQTGSYTASITLPDWMAYNVNTNKLTIYNEGLKLVRDARSATYVFVTGTGLTTQTSCGLAASTVYTVDVTVGAAAPVTLSVTTNSPTTTFAALVTLLNSAAQLMSVPVTFVLDVYSTTALRIVCEANTSGAGNAITLSSAVGSLFASIPNVQPYVTAAGATYDYTEVGAPGSLSTQITLASAPSTNHVIEFILAH